MISSISVIIPVRNGAALLTKAVHSIQVQGIAVSEILIVDDASTDDTAQVIQRLSADDNRIRGLRRTAQGGPAAARNDALAECAGEIIAFLDADDVWPEDKLTTQMEHLRTAESPVVIGQTVAYRQSEDGWIPSSPPWPFPVVGAALFRREVFDRVGNFNPTLRASEDVDWYLRARDAGIPPQSYSYVALHYRRHGENMTRGKNLEALDFPRALKASLDRRRAQNLPHPTAVFTPPENTEISAQ